MCCSLRCPKFLQKSETQKCFGFKAITMHGRRAGSSHFPFLYMSQRRPHSLHHVSHCQEGQQHTVCCRLRWPKFLPKSASKKCFGFKAITMHGWRAVSSHLPFLYMSQRRPHSLHHVSHCREGQQHTVCCRLRVVSKVASLLTITQYWQMDHKILFTKLRWLVGCGWADPVN